MSDFGSRNMGFFGGASTGGGGGTSTGVNGLNGTTNIGLGGTLTIDTTINGNGQDLIIGDDPSLLGLYKSRYNTLDFQMVNGNNISGIVSNSSDMYFGYQNNNTGNSSIIRINDIEIRTQDQNGNNGLLLDFDNQLYTLGDYDSINNDTKLVVNDANNTMQTFGSNGQGGLNFNFSTEQYILGATLSKVTCDNTNTQLTLSCSSIILSNTPSITSATITTSATPTIPSNYLSIQINSVNYKIQLFNP
jgi:hypothetical protein